MLWSKVIGAGGAGGGGVSYWLGLLGGTGLDLFNGVAIDFADNIVAAGRTASDGAGGTDCLVTPYNSSGTFLWGRTLGGAGFDLFNSVSIDSTNNIIAVGVTLSDGAGAQDSLIAKYDSSGTLLWSRTLGGADSESFNDVAVDSTNNIVAVGEHRIAGVAESLIAKYNSSGTLLWSRKLGGAGADLFNGVAIDSADNIVAVGQTASDGAGGTDCLIAKYNSSGALLWDRTLGGAGFDRYVGVAIDSTNNIIAVGATSSDGAGVNDCLIAKYDSSGAILWDRTLGGTGTDIFLDVAVDFADNIVAVGQTDSDGAGGTDCLIAKLPPDGSGTGTYGSLIYQAAVLTDDVAVLTDALVGLSDLAVTLTDEPAVLTDAPAILTEELFEIPA